MHACIVVVVVTLDTSRLPDLLAVRLRSLCASTFEALDFISHHVILFSSCLLLLSHRWFSIPELHPAEHMVYGR
jgi:hypothetical protein